MAIQIQFAREKETKRTWRYAEVETEGPPIVGSLYVQKWALREEFGEVPERLDVTIEVASEENYL